MKDLHIHTIYSDGEFDEFQIIEKVKQAGITEFAICDHDAIDGSKKVADILKSQNNDLIFHSGVELSCRLKEYKNGINMHILVYDFDYDDKILNQIVDKISSLRLEKIKRMKDHLEKIYEIQIPQEKIDKHLKTTKAFGKPHMFTILQELGSFDREEYYCHMDKLNNYDLKVDANFVLKNLAGRGKTVLAHPIEVVNEYNLDDTGLENLVAYLKNLGLFGIEVKHSKQTLEFQQKIKNFAQKYGLFESEGSDFHGPKIQPHIQLGVTVKNN